MVYLSVSKLLISFVSLSVFQNLEKETALHCAAQYGHSEVVCVLLQELTDPSMRNSRGETPLDLAALYGRLQVVRMLLSAHPNLMSLNTCKHTPLHLAARNGHHSTIQALLEAGMDVNTEVCVTLHLVLGWECIEECLVVLTFQLYYPVQRFLLMNSVFCLDGSYMFL